MSRLPFRKKNIILSFIKPRVKYEYPLGKTGNHRLPALSGHPGGVCGHTRRQGGGARPRQAHQLDGGAEKCGNSAGIESCDILHVPGACATDAGTLCALLLRQKSRF